MKSLIQYINESKYHFSNAAFKSIEDAKKEEMRIAKEKQQQAINARMNRRQQLMGRRPVNNSSAANTSYSDSANIDAEDLEDAFGI